MKRTLVQMILIFAVSGCQSSSGWRMPYSDDLSRAPGAAFAGEGMNFRKVMPHREDRRPWEFYYKHCALNGSESFFSHTSYDCAGPAY